MERARDMVNASFAHQRGLTGRGIGVAIVDTGLYPHRDFDETKINCFVDFVNGKEQMYDDCGHGTHIAGIIAGSGKASKGQYRGIAPGVSLVIVKALDHKGNGKMRNVINCLEWIYNNYLKYNIRIVNISMGTTMKIRNNDNSILVNAVEKLWDKGIIVCVAAGNLGPRQGSVTMPGISPKVITVGFISEKENYSGRGPTNSCVMKPEIIAPGDNIISCDYNATGYTRKSGSSMATPIVSGAIALMLENNPDLTNKEVKIKLYERALDIGYPKNIQGWGYLDIARLLC